MSWHPKINTARRTALKEAAKNVKKQSVEERLAKIEKKVKVIETNAQAKTTTAEERL